MKGHRRMMCRRIVYGQEQARDRWCGAPMYIHEAEERLARSTRWSRQGSVHVILMLRSLARRGVKDDVASVVCIRKE